VADEDIEPHGADAAGSGGERWRIATNQAKVEDSGVEVGVPTLRTFDSEHELNPLPVKLGYLQTREFEGGFDRGNTRSWLSRLRCHGPEILTA
jgi:hypothetical protein